MIITREQIEAQEAERLAPYASLSHASRGRAYPEDEHPYRTAYQRDRDRVIHTTAFRRLEYKTQVFVITEGNDYYRTRLTHTVEVAQIGRTVARALGVNEDLTEAICLAHDLGHSPFGHSGEGALNEIMAAEGGFNHNYQSYRIIDKLESRFPEYEGLNLSWEVREGIIKHETDYDFSEVLHDFEPDWRPSLEAQIVDVADEIAYTTADLDDGLRAGMIVPEQLRDIEIWSMVVDELGLNPYRHFSDMDRHRLIRRLVGKEVSDLIDATNVQLEQHNVRSQQELRRLPHNIVKHSADFAPLDRQLKKFLYNNMYRHWRVMRMDRKARRFIGELFTAYVESPIILPYEVQADIKRRGLRRTVCDYIAGMTDRFALKEYDKLFNPMERV